MRHLLALLATPLFAAGAAAPLSDLHSQGDRLKDAWERVDRLVERSMREFRTPGLALAVTSRDGLLRASNYGLADLKTRAPVRDDTLFEIGSTSKSFTAIVLLQLREEGKLDLRKPVVDYLPWFRIRSRFDPITVHDLLTHRAGLPRDRDDVPSSLYQVAALAERETGSPPGKAFAYSNIGFQLLGYLAEEAGKEPFPAALRRRILEPLGMTSSVPSFTHGTRARLAVGYTPLYDDRPPHPSHPLVEATWLEYGAGDGSIAATASDLAAYLRMLLRRGEGPKGRVLSEAGFELLLSRPVPGEGPEYYAYGMNVSREKGRTEIAHGGGMIGYACGFVGDLDAGVGAVALVNGPGEPGGISRFAMAAAAAAIAGSPLPPLPESRLNARVEKPADYAGRYRTAEGKTLSIEAKGEELLLLAGSDRIPLELRGRDAFLANHPDFDLFLLRFVREGDRVVEAVHGPDAYARDGTTPKPPPSAPEEWRAYPGHYRCQSPWLSNLRVVLRKGRLLLALPQGAEVPLVPLEPGLFRVGEEESAERLRFDSIVNGRALRANFSGVDLYRFFTP
ncbi:MAG TPA: serine hydrolase domain-containing protein [Planctomycetota bacterium]|jgi:CubicO group peptidase (beta-lactamase class C family)|nr:serine hydrolase domain-containing protein [Planctomycetota bacterium]